jgi:hypothetical protein
MYIYVYTYIYVGIRPTKGLISRAGIMPLSYTQDAIGPIARTPKDLVIHIYISFLLSFLHIYM